MLISGPGFGLYPSGSLFTPKSIPNLEMWLRADLGITIATGVSAWADQSGNGHNATQATGANQPTLVTNALNGQPIVRFGSPFVMGLAGTFTGATPRTVFAVMKTTAGAGPSFAAVCLLATSVMYFYARTSGLNRWGFHGTAECQASYDVSSAFKAVTGRVTTTGAGGVQLNTKGQTVETGSLGGAASGGATSLLGASTAAGTTNNSSADLAEICTFTRVLSDLEVSQLEAYAANRYAI